jgi:hypothetical protein
MRVFIFLIYLCSLLLRGYDYSYIGTQYNSIRASVVQYFENGQPPKLANANRDDSVIRDAGPGEEEEYLVRNDVEDEDGNNIFARKYKLQASRNLIATYTCIAGYLHNSFKDRLSFYPHSSYIYIVQRALRI